MGRESVRRVWHDRAWAYACLGCLFGYAFCWVQNQVLEIGVHSSTSLQEALTDQPPFSSSATVVATDQVRLRPTSHLGIFKRQLLEHSAIPNVAGCAVVDVLPGKLIATHVHGSMHEFFYVLSGQGYATVTDWPNELVTMKTGDFLHVPPTSAHAFSVASEDTEPLRLFYCGVTVGPKLG
jgi:mannose-6-phosphate isomerase-like protein (cupin superfamily)